MHTNAYSVICLIERAFKKCSKIRNLFNWTRPRRLRNLNSSTQSANMLSRKCLQKIDIFTISGTVWSTCGSLDQGGGREGYPRNQGRDSMARKSTRADLPAQIWYPLNSSDSLPANQAGTFITKKCFYYKLACWHMSRNGYQICAHRFTRHWIPPQNLILNNEQRNWIWYIIYHDLTHAKLKSQLLMLMC